ncbi:hypothetical protein CC78DRAFT_577883 [Lojkania enalia]|uniref:Uncharacterized protein n=1 Tax=Lojkania enalia TaxID=147567 RepID=A0A9P4KC87_9PLEO|nr:hypothetical protein CC78DRAFT_577883 [Didymosphaeria enalia]
MEERGQQSLNITGARGRAGRTPQSKPTRARPAVVLPRYASSRTQLANSSGVAPATAICTSGPDKLQPSHAGCPSRHGAGDCHLDGSLESGVASNGLQASQCQPNARWSHAALQSLAPGTRPRGRPLRCTCTYVPGNMHSSPGIPGRHYWGVRRAHVGLR